LRLRNDYSGNETSEAFIKLPAEYPVPWTGMNEEGG